MLLNLTGVDTATDTSWIYCSRQVDAWSIDQDKQNIIFESGATPMNLHAGIRAVEAVMKKYDYLSEGSTEILKV